MIRYSLKLSNGDKVEENRQPFFLFFQCSIQCHLIRIIFCLFNQDVSDPLNESVFLTYDCKIKYVLCFIII